MRQPDKESDLVEQIELLREALRPFADLSAFLESSARAYPALSPTPRPDTHAILIGPSSEMDLTVGTFRRAAEVYRQTAAPAPPPLGVSVGEGIKVKTGLV